MAKEVIKTADKIKKWREFKRIVKISLIALLFVLIVVYLVLVSIFQRGTLSIYNDGDNSSIVIYESVNDPHSKRRLFADGSRFMTNISIKWLPQNINNETDGSHNGDNYIAYTFYVENQGTEATNYWYRMVMDDVIKDADEAIRVMIYRNDEKVVYAKESTTDGQPEKETTAFLKDEDGTIILQKRENIEPYELDKFTIVIWIEGDDPECTNSLLGGEVKMHMDITEDHIRE